MMLIMKMFTPKGAQKCVLWIDMIKLINKKLYIGGQEFILDNYIFHSEISQGANGVVFHVTDAILFRDAALKIWLKLRPKDLRNKSKQGLLETKKVLDANKVLLNWVDPKLNNTYFVSDPSEIFRVDHKVFGEIYTSGEVNGYFYTVMEYIDGLTLKEILKHEHYLVDECRADLFGGFLPGDGGFLPLGLKVAIAEKLAMYNRILLTNGIIHGDLHWGNIIINNLLWEYHETSFYDDIKYSYNIRIIDFGTSYYSGEKVSIKRNFDVLIETIDKCIYPFSLEKISCIEKPKDYDKPEEIMNWIEIQLKEIRAGFFEMGSEYVGWPYYNEYGLDGLSSNNGSKQSIHNKEVIEALIKENKVYLSQRYLGNSETWSRFDGRYAKRGD